MHDLIPAIRNAACGFLIEPFRNFSTIKKLSIMTTSEATTKLKSVKDLSDFQELFFSDDGDGEMTPNFSIEYKTGENNFTDSEASKIYDAKGNCVNAYIKCEDGYVEYPF